MQDSMTLAIAHQDGTKAIDLDAPGCFAHELEVDE
jgi:hypothetical protein